MLRAASGFYVRPSTFRRMETLAAARYGLRDIDGLNQAESGDPALRASMTHALSLLDRFGQDVKPDVSNYKIQCFCQRTFVLQV